MRSGWLCGESADSMGGMLPYAVTIFLGAFLLFQVQPLMGKFILPWFGGGPGVWTTCMLFFQVLLLGGYAYAHWLTQRLKPKAQGRLHVALLVLAVAALPIRPGEQWKPPGDGNPVLQILALLAACVGLPYFVLSSTGPLIQHWFHRQFTGRSPYRLYALSNLGSLLALISYPFAVEPQLTRKTQASVWGIGLVLYVAACAWCALRNLGGVQAVGSEQAAAASPGWIAGPRLPAVARVSERRRIRGRTCSSADRSGPMPDAQLRPHGCPRSGAPPAPSRRRRRASPKPSRSLRSGRSCRPCCGCSRASSARSRWRPATSTRRPTGDSVWISSITPGRSSGRPTGRRPRSRSVSGRCAGTIRRAGPPGCSRR